MGMHGYSNSQISHAIVKPLARGDDVQMHMETFAVADEAKSKQQSSADDSLPTETGRPNVRELKQRLNTTLSEVLPLVDSLNATLQKSYEDGSFTCALSEVQPSEQAASNCDRKKQKAEVSDAPAAANTEVEHKEPSGVRFSDEAAISFSSSRPKFSKPSRAQRVVQLNRTIDEFCSMEFDSANVEVQGALAFRMLSTLKSLSSTDVFWTDSGDKCKELRYMLLGLEDTDMEAISQHIKCADEHCDERKFRIAFEEMQKVIGWLRGTQDQLEALRADWLKQKQAILQEEDKKYAAGGYRFLPETALQKSSTDQFTIVSLNILAGALGRPKTHGYCKPEILDWENRKQKLLEGVERSVPDLLLLQEVQGTTLPHKDDHFTHLKDSLAGLGYDLGAYGRLSDKNGCELGTDSKSKSKKKAHIGNAIFFRTHVWQHVDNGRISFAQVLADRCKDNAAMCKHYSHGEQIAAWARLLHIPTSKVVVVVSVHVGANWRNPDTQIAQIDAMLKQLETIVQKGESLVIGGDFNSQPTGGAYEYLSKGVLLADHPDVCPKDAALEKLCGDAGYQTPFKLCSAYAALCGFEPEFTTKEGISPDRPEAVAFSGTLDYLWYSAGSLQPLTGTALPTPTIEEASDGLPNAEIPSDHIPLGLALSFSDPDDKREVTEACRTPDKLQDSDQFRAAATPAKLSKSKHPLPNSTQDISKSDLLVNPAPD
jgi:mRNA deadenylase 3'-5' endonuclease subunit Ccr4